MKDRLSEEKYRRLVEDANSIIMRMDTEGKITFFNEFAQIFFGYKEDEILGHSVIGTIVPDTATSGQDLKAMIGDIMLNPEKYVNNENENMLRSGQRVWIAWTNRPVVDKENHLREVLCIGNDITKLKQAVEERFDTVVQNLSEGVVSCSLDWKIKYANIAAKEYLGIKEVESRSFPEIIYGNYCPSINREDLLDLSVLHKKFDIIRRESEQFEALYLEADLNVLKNMRDDPDNIVVLFRNVTDARKEEKIKQDFLSLISHKLNTPLTAINYSASMIKSSGLENLSPKQKKHIDGIVDGTSQLMALITNLIAFITINNKELDFKATPIEAHTYLPQLTDSMVKSVMGKKIEINIDCAQKDIVVNISREHFDIIIRNLVDNAVKFSDKDVVKISIGASKNMGKVEISVSDNGCGIPPEDYDRIFEKFYQIEKYFTGNIPGAGLGLPLVKHLVSGYSGSIRLESELGRGTKFIISLPA